MDIRRTLVVACVALGVVASPLVVPVLAHGNIVKAVPQQATDGEVLAESVYSLDDTWLVAHRDDDGSIGEAIGHTAISPNQLHTEVAVPIDDDVWSSWDGTRTVHLVLHLDDGDGSFSPTDDEILETNNVTAGTTVTVERASGPVYVHASRIDRIETNGSVPIREATLPAGGFVVLESPDGDRTVGHFGLDAGTHEDLEVRIDETYYRQQSTRFEVRAVLYRDDGNGEFDDADSPITAGSEPIGTTVELARTDDRTPTGDTSDDSSGDDGESHEHDDGHDHETTAADGSSPTATEGSDGPGFGVAVTLAAVLIGALLGIRRLSH